MLQIAKRLQSVKPSQTLAVSAKAKELQEKGIKIISLATGEPDFDTPDNIKEAAIKAIQNGDTKYTNVSGTVELRKAICAKFKRENNLDYKPEEIIVGTGGKQVIYNLLMATINEGDQVIIPAPYWVSYPDMVALAGGVPVYIKSDMNQGFRIESQAIKEVICNKTKWLILNSPSNPSGAAYREKELEEIAALLRQYPHVNIMCDDIYEHIVYDNFVFKTLATVAPDLKERIFIINGVSKAYSMTGWRIGYGAGRSDLVKAMSVVQSQSTSNPSSISQMAAIEALSGTQSYIKPNALGFQKKRDLTLSLINNIEGLECSKPEGAFYLFPKCSGLFGKLTPNGHVLLSSTDVATYLLEAAHVAVVPGIAFGMRDYFRISYATSEELLTEACGRILKAILDLKQSS